MLGCSWPGSPAQSKPACLVWRGLYLEALNISFGQASGSNSYFPNNPLLLLFILFIC